MNTIDRKRAGEWDMTSNKCTVCGIEETVTTYCVVDGDYHVTYGTTFVTPDELVWP
jgi:hypothetical protein